jgi:hypothetical protein
MLTWYVAQVMSFAEDESLPMHEFSLFASSEAMLSIRIQKGDA